MLLISVLRSGGMIHGLRPEERKYVGDRQLILTNGFSSRFSVKMNVLV